MTAPLLLTERLEAAARRLARRSETLSGNFTKKAVERLCATPLGQFPPVEPYLEEQRQEMAERDAAWAEFVAAVTGRCVCGAPVAYPKPEELNDGKGATRNCACGRNFVIG